MLSWINLLGCNTQLYLQKVGCSVRFFTSFLCSIRHDGIRLRAVLKQMHLLGTASLLVIAVAAAFIGMVVAVQGFHTLEKFGAEAQLSQLLGLSVFRELGPVICALLYAGRAGGSLAAEIGLMQATEQISAMQVMAINPLSRVVFPRWLAGIICLPLLTLIFCAVALWGGYWVAVVWLKIDAGVFWSNMQSAVTFQSDVMGGVYKSIAFAIIVNWVALYQGFKAIPNASGVGAATTKTVVVASLVILAVDFIMTALMFGG